jgi:hypothetical protein
MIISILFNYEQLVSESECNGLLNFTTLLVVFYASIKHSLIAFYAKFMTLFDVFYNNLLRSKIVRMFYTKFCTHLRCFSSRFTLK